MHNPESETILPPTVKHRSRMLWYIADHKAREQSRNPAALGITLDGPGGSFTETSIGHFLAVVKGVVTTPPRETVLDGISLRVTEELCRSLKIPFLEDRLWLSGLHKYSEVMLAGTGFCLAGVSELFTWNPQPGRFAWPGPVFTKLLAAWSDLVGVDIARQFTG